MNALPFWIARGGVDIGNVARNIHKEIRKIRPVQAAQLTLVKTSPMSEQQAALLATRAIVQAQEQDHEIQVQINGPAIIVNWNTPGFKSETFECEEQWKAAFQEMQGLWATSKKKERIAI